MYGSQTNQQQHAGNHLIKHVGEGSHTCQAAIGTTRKVMRKDSGTEEEERMDSDNSKDNKPREERKEMARDRARAELLHSMGSVTIVGKKATRSGIVPS